MMGRRAATDSRRDPRRDEYVSHGDDSGSRDDAAGDADGGVFRDRCDRAVASGASTFSVRGHLDFEGGIACASTTSIAAM